MKTQYTPFGNQGQMVFSKGRQEIQRHKRSFDNGRISIFEDEDRARSQGMHVVLGGHKWPGHRLPYREKARRNTALPTL